MCRYIDRMICRLLNYLDIVNKRISTHYVRALSIDWPDYRTERSDLFLCMVEVSLASRNRARFFWKFSIYENFWGGGVKFVSLAVPTVLMQGGVPNRVLKWRLITVYLIS